MKLKSVLLAGLAAIAIGCEEEEKPVFRMEPPPQGDQVIKLPAGCNTLEKHEFVNADIERIYCRDDKNILTIYTKFVNIPEWTARRYEP
ncbi:MAG: hypothetical protein PHO02_03205 [Candidatus Nanoarchaeia archaeon]|nr:hypothetical protein [Candidatus Nanoarchaeia archaeon]